MKRIKASHIPILSAFLILNSLNIKAQHDSTTIVTEKNRNPKENFEPNPNKSNAPSSVLPVILTTNNAWMFGIGGVNMYDTYLSPLKYTGFSAKIYNEKMRRTTWFNNRFDKQQILGIEFAKGDNPAKNATNYWLLADYRLGGHYRVVEHDNIRLGIGGLWDIDLGVLYNERNGNNPASARAYTNLNASVLASYKLSWFALRWQLDTPFIGMLFSPKYGQSYYEISIGNSAKVVNFASFHNQRALRNYITLDIPINKNILRIGYLGSYYQTKVHSINTHHYTNSFVIGFPLEGIKSKREKTRNIYW